jgi:peptidoglycan hydrolase-like protein with peptidoglycan-binding domain
VAGEPELSKGQASEWVVYLQQLLRHNGYWDDAEDGAFDDQLETAVQWFQQQYQLGSDGVVRADTWAVLTGVVNQSTVAASGADQEPAALQGTVAEPTEVPASYALGGLPAFRYTLPTIPIAEATLDTGALIIELKLTRTGNVTSRFHTAPAASQRQ